MSLAAQFVLLPVHVGLAWIYWAMAAPTRRENGAGLDWLALTCAVIGWGTTVFFSLGAKSDTSPIWPVVLATFAGFLVFSAILALFLLIRLVQGHRRD